MAKICEDSFKKRLNDFFGVDDGSCRRCANPRPEGSLMFCPDCAAFLFNETFGDVSRRY